MGQIKRTGALFDFFGLEERVPAGHRLRPIRWAVEDPVRVPSVFTKCRDRLPTTELARKVMAVMLAHRDEAPLLSDKHFLVDGTPVKAWVSMKSFPPKPS